MKVTTPAYGLKIPGPKPFLNAEIYCTAYEDEVGPGDSEATIRAARRAMQAADMKAMLAQLPALFQEAIKAGYDQVRVAPPIAMPPVPEPIVEGLVIQQGALVSQTTRTGLREASLQIHKLTGQPPNGRVIKTQEEADICLRSLRDAISLLINKDKKESGGATMPAAQRICHHHDHPVRNPKFLSINEWDYSMEKYGSALCRVHQAEASAAIGERLLTGIDSA